MAISQTRLTFLFAGKYNTNGDKSTHGRGFIDRDETVEPGEIYY